MTPREALAGDVERQRLEHLGNVLGDAGRRVLGVDRAE
jgi:hypothetical protein